MGYELCVHHASLHRMKPRWEQSPRRVAIRHVQKLQLHQALHALEVSVTQLTSISQIVHVVSMLEVPSRFKSVSFQSKDVKGALNSLFLFCKKQQKLITHRYRHVTSCLWWRKILAAESRC